MIKEAHDSGGYIVCRSIDQAAHISKMAIEHGFDIMLPITYHEFVSRKLNGINIKCLHIDNADHLLQYIAGNVPVKSITITGGIK